MEENQFNQNYQNLQNYQSRNNLLIPFSIIIAGIIIAGSILISQRDNNQNLKDIFVPSATTTESNQGIVLKDNPKPLAGIIINFEGWPSLGKNDAPIVMVEYSDFACPFCGSFQSETFPHIKKDYIDTGKVRFVYKDFPVVGGQKAAEAAHCAAEQGKYWEYHDLLFAKQSQDRAQWSSVDVHIGYAKQLGLDVDRFTKCFNDNRYQEKVNQSAQEAMKNGAQGTPYFLINNVPIFGAQPYSNFKELIDSLLSQQ